MERKSISFVWKEMLLSCCLLHVVPTNLFFIFLILYTSFPSFCLTLYLLLGLAGIDWMIMKSLKVKKFPYLKTSAIKLHQIHIKTLTSSSISTLIHSVSLKTPNKKVVDHFLGVPQHLESSQSELL
jgi:ABC-type xylose transport system permease subunit